MLLTVARQFVICTRFPINLQLSKTFSVDEVCKELIGVNVCIIFLELVIKKSTNKLMLIFEKENL
uniref:Uncharacterized protein n=1 Tax=Tenacibaculum sp. Pbs-1 TaxID=3238748 RepID=A0AB33L2A2_9FLAO